MKPIKVMKFGGTSVATAESRLLAARKVVGAVERGYAPVVVVSAIGRKGEPYATDTLLSLLSEVDPLMPYDLREMDLMLCCGEIMSTCIFAQTLKSLGQPASAMTGGQAGLITDEAHGNARIIEVRPNDILRIVGKGRVPVVCGFQGRSDSSDGAIYGEITTLGRGGSDTTASALGAALHAEAIEIYTDVDGVKTADPSIVENAPTLGKMTYDEVAEIAHQGAKVLHPRAAQIALKYGIPLWVKSTFTDESGTEIVSDEAFAGRRVTGVTHTGKLVYLHFELESEEEKRSIELQVYRLMAENKVNLFMVNTHENSFAFAVPRKQLAKVKEILDGLVIPLSEEGRVRKTFLVQVGRAKSTEMTAQEKMLSGLGPIERCLATLTENCTIVSVIAHEFLQQPGIFRRVVEALNKGAIKIIQTSDSLLSVSVLVPESDAERAVKFLHAEFDLAGAI
ncbi:MAG: aspartate kinase [Armatimonadota bacterium]|nr:aspartate kinase [Armatimonadota bacterium]